MENRWPAIGYDDGVLLLALGSKGNGWCEVAFPHAWSSQYEHIMYISISNLNICMSHIYIWHPRIT